ncbi:hypothetical protein FB451DRAFT_1561923, partial [Mycena latifolia]
MDPSKTPAYTPPAGIYPTPGTPNPPGTYTPPPGPPAGYQQQGHYAQPPPQGYAPQPQMNVIVQPGMSYSAQMFAQCEQGNHQMKTKYGMFGLITAIACFPCGILALFIDNEQKCERCGFSPP